MENGGAGVRAVEMRKTKRVGDRERRWRKRESEMQKGMRKGEGAREKEGDHVRKDGSGEGATGRQGEEREEGTIGGKSGRPRKGGRVRNERGETHHIKPRRAEKKRFALPGLAMG